MIPALNYEETRLMAIELLDVRELSDHLSNILWERIGGRPLFNDGKRRFSVSQSGDAGGGLRQPSAYSKAQTTPRRRILAQTGSI
ncbi:MAG: hypothetical protein CUN53_01375 [Phototrophicales bacterium]|nr:MAG: hypothetical protein CUN53_01375 [Phototrophicales bacterium]